MSEDVNEVFEEAVESEAEEYEFSCPALPVTAAYSTWTKSSADRAFEEALPPRMTGHIQVVGRKRAYLIPVRKLLWHQKSPVSVEQVYYGYERSLLNLVQDILSDPAMAMEIVELSREIEEYKKELRELEQKVKHVEAYPKRLPVLQRRIVSAGLSEEDRKRLEELRETVSELEEELDALLTQAIFEYMSKCAERQAEGRLPPDDFFCLLQRWDSIVELRDEPVITEMYLKAKDEILDLTKKAIVQMLEQAQKKMMERYTPGGIVEVELEVPELPAERKVGRYRKAVLVPELVETKEKEGGKEVEEVEKKAVKRRLKVEKPKRIPQAFETLMLAVYQAAAIPEEYEYKSAWEILEEVFEELIEEKYRYVTGV